MTGKKYNRKYKDSLFRMIFREKENLLSLYNAVNHTDYTNADDLEVVTLENAIYMNIKNDMAFLMCDFLNMYEHQSTQNPNMPLRDLFYIACEYEKLVDEKSLYRTKAIKIPTPRFIVFYNGTEEAPENQILKLSDLYSIPQEMPELELKVQMLNINYGHNRELMEQCKVLKDYSIYVSKLRAYAAGMPLEDAVEYTIKECIEKGILDTFLKKYRREAVRMSIFEYDEEAVMKMLQEDAREIGWEQGKREGREVGIQEGRKEGRQEGIQEGRKEGILEGRQEGQTQKLIEMVCKKLRKSKSPETIAEELEEELSYINQICDVARECAPKYDIEEIYGKLKKYLD